MSPIICPSTNNPTGFRTWVDSTLASQRSNQFNQRVRTASERLAGWLGRHNSNPLWSMGPFTCDWSKVMLFASLLSFLSNICPNYHGLSKFADGHSKTNLHTIWQTRNSTGLIDQTLKSQKTKNISPKLAQYRHSFEWQSGSECHPGAQMLNWHIGQSAGWDWHWFRPDWIKRVTHSTSNFF